MLMLTLGDAMIIELPDEIFEEFEKTIQYRNVIAKCFVIKLASGELPDYVFAAQANAEDGHEAKKFYKYREFQ